MLIIINCIHTRKEDQAVTNVLDNFIRSYYTDFAAFVKDDARRSRKIQSAPKTYAPTKRQEIKKPSEISWLSDHIADKSKPHKCQVCSKCFTTKQVLERHNLIHKGERLFVYEKCGKDFNKKCNLKCHQKVHGDEREFRCHHCKKDFKHSQSLKKHIREKHKPEEY